MCNYHALHFVALLRCATTLWSRHPKWLLHGQFGFGEGGFYTFHSFKRRADDFEKKWFCSWDRSVTASEFFTFYSFERRVQIVSRRSCFVLGTGLSLPVRSYSIGHREDDLKWKRLCPWLQAGVHIVHSRSTYRSLWDWCVRRVSWVMMCKMNDDVWIDPWDNVRDRW